MPPKAEKLLEKLRQTKRNWSCENLTTILEGMGFEWHDSKHRVFRHPQYNDIRNYPIPRYDSLAPQYAKDVLTLVDDVLARETKDNEE